MNIYEKYKWLARDEDGVLYCFINKPRKKSRFWDDDDTDDNSINHVKETDKRFCFISWEQSEPTSVEYAKEILGTNNLSYTSYLNEQANLINKPSHYIGINGLEVEEVLQNFIPKYKDGYTAHRVSSAIEYLLRSPEKNLLEDIKKAKRNLEQIIEYEENKETKECQ